MTRFHFWTPLSITIIRGDDFGIIPRNVMVCLKHANWQGWFLTDIETAFWCSFKGVPNWRFVLPRYSFPQPPHGIVYAKCVFCLISTRSFSLAKICPNIWRGFKATFIPQLFRTLQIGSATPFMYRTTAKPFEESPFQELYLAAAGAFKQS